MLEQIARAICRENLGYRGVKESRWPDQIVDDEWEDYIPHAKSALMAMMNPSDDMVSAGDTIMLGYEDMRSTRSLYAAMIRTVLEEAL